MAVNVLKRLYKQEAITSEKVNKLTPLSTSMASGTFVRFSDGTKFRCLEVEARKRDEAASSVIYDFYAVSSDCNIF